MSFQISSSFLFLGGCLSVGLFFAHAYLQYHRNLRIVGSQPGIRTIISTIRPSMMVMPSGKLPFGDWSFSIGPDYWIHSRHKPFKKYGQDIISSVSLDLYGPCVVVGDAEAAQEAMNHRARFAKPTELYDVLDLFGRNIVSTEGEEWRAHRKITAPSFTENNNRLVCEETAFVVEGLFDLWKGKPVVEYEDVTEVTIALALMVICGAGFGKRVSWIDTAPPEGHRMTFKGAIEIASLDLIWKAVLPDFFMPLTARTARIQLGFEELQKYISEMIHERTKNYRDFSDLFSNLIEANENDDEGLRLTTPEMMGNIFIFLIAGHETTGHSLAFALGMLALYPDVQESLYQHVSEHVADPTGAPTYAELGSLNYATAVFFEALRMFPPVSLIPKRATVDTTLQTVNNKGEPVTIPIPKGTVISINTPAIHHNPRYWKNPDEFQPERFLGDWQRQAFIPFSTGVRSCIGRRFAEVEATVALSILVRNYRIEIKPNALGRPGESLRERRERILACRDRLTVTPKGIPLRFTRRQS